MQVAAATGLKPKATHRRPHNSDIDGPFAVAPGDSSTRVKQIAKTLAMRDSGVDAGQYEADRSKDSCLRNTSTGAVIGTGVRGEGRIFQHHALSISEALAKGQTWVDTAMYGPIGVRQLGGQQGSLLDPWEQAAFNMPPYASGQALSTRYRQVDERVLPASAHTAHSVRASAGNFVADMGAAAVHVSTAQAGTCFSTPRDWDGGAPQMKGHNQVLDSAALACRTQPRPPPARLFMPQKPPPREVLRSAQRAISPGEWDWEAVSRSLCNTFTMQDGGAFRNDRAKPSPSTDQRGAGAGSHKQILAETMASQAAAAAGDPLPGKAPRAGKLGDAGRSGEESPGERKAANAVALDPMTVQRREAARRAALHAQGVRSRQKRWEMQSALLPLLKREAMQQERSRSGDAP